MPKNWNIRVIRGKPKYEKVYLAFLDVLGFKNLLKARAAENPKYIVKIFEKIDRAIQHPQESGLVQKYISDSILIWCTHPASVPYMIEVCHELQDQLLLEGCLVRGTIVSGQHYSASFDQLNIITGERDNKSGDILVSPALVKAYAVEADLHDPVIKVQGAVINDINQLNESFSNTASPATRRLNPRQYFDLPGYLMSRRYAVLRAGAARTGRPDKGWQREPSVKDAVRGIKQIRQQILTGLKNRDRRIRRKWSYAKTNFNLRVMPLAEKWDLMGSMCI